MDLNYNSIDNNLYLEQIERELQAERNKNLQMQNVQNSLFGMPSEDNLIRWQLDLREDLDRIYHLLKGHQIKEDGEGNTVYVEAESDELKPFNEFGVQMLMNIMSFYLNRNTLLSNYDEETIYWKVYDFGKELSFLIYTRFEEMGMDTLEKIKMFPMIVLELVDTIHSAYLRALDSGERDSLRTARTVTQNEPIGAYMGMPNRTVASVQSRRFSLFRPSTWT